MKSPDTGLTSYDYDIGGRVDRVAAADGKVTTFEWDKLGRRTNRCSAGECHTYSYDGGAFGKGRLTRFDDWSGNTSYEYNAAGHIVRQINNIYGKIFVTDWSFDVLGRLETMTYPTGLVLTYEYDARGRRSVVKSVTPLRVKNELIK